MAVAALAWGLAWCGVGEASAEPAVQPYAESTRLWSHDRRVLPFRVDPAPEQDLTLEAAVDRPEILTALGPARVLAGESIGFVRVEAKEPGEAQLTIGSRAIRVSVASSPTGFFARLRGPRIVSPADGAAVWGDFKLSVEVFDEFGQLSLAGEEVLLRLPSGDSLFPVSASSPDEGPHRRFVFAIEASALEAGPQTLVAEVRGVPGVASSSAPVNLKVYEHEALSFVADREAEADADAPRPRRAGGQRDLKIADHGEASDGRYVLQSARGRSIAVPIPVDAPGGWYAVRVRAGGTSVSALPPIVGVFVDAEDRARTIGALADTAWHHAPLGRPFWLDPPDADERQDEVDARPGEDGEPLYAWPAGHRVLTLRFENDFAAGKKVDRNLFLDRVEVVRLPGRSAPPALARVSAALPAHAVRGPFAGLDPALDGSVLAGPRRIVGFVGGLEPESLPEVQLVLNGNPVVQTRDARPSFWLTPGQCAPGENHIQLVATDPATGQRVASTTHRVFVDEALAHTPTRAVRFFAMQDASWRPPQNGAIVRHNRAGRRHVVAFHSRGHIDLKLPEGLSGRTRIELHGLGDLYDGWPIARVSWVIPGEDGALRTLGEARFQRWENVHDLGEFEVPTDAEALRVAFVNDAYDVDTGRDRNLYLSGVTLWESPPGIKEHATAAVVHPRSGETIGLADAMVAEVRSASRVTWAEAVVDGEPTGLRFAVSPGQARVMVPLIQRGRATDRPVPVTLALRIGDGDDVLAESPAVSVTLDAKANDPAIGGTRYARAVAFLNRVALGPEPRAVADVLAEGPEAWLDRTLTAGWMGRPGLRDAWLQASLGRQNEERRDHLNRRAAEHLLRTPNPVRARLAMFVDNHLTTWWLKASPRFRIEDHARWVEMGAAPFSELLFASATSPAMLRYLDQQRSFANRLNENYAREIMELHTVGVNGGYDQADVTCLAKLLTGWRFDETAREDAFGRLTQGTFRYLPQRNLPEAQRIFGYAFPEAKPLSSRFDRARSAVELLASHPSTAEFIGEKLVAHYAGLPADAALTQAAVRAFHETAGDLRAVIRAVVLHPEFLDKARDRRLAHPLGFAVRLQRIAGTANPRQVVGYTNQSGFGLFDRDTPDGYPEEDDAYADTNATLQRWRYAGDVSGGLVRKLPDGLAYPRNLTDTQARADWQQSLVDHLAVLITGDLLSEASNDAALSVLRETEEQGWARNRLLAQFVAQLPESALR